MTDHMVVFKISGEDDVAISYDVVGELGLSEACELHLKVFTAGS